MVETMRGSVEQYVVERVDDGDKEKKKKRRSNRRSKQNASISNSASCNSISGIHSEASVCSENGRTDHHVTTFPNDCSIKQLDTRPLDEASASSAASNIAFGSLPTMHLSKQVGLESLHNRHIHSSDDVREVISESCPEPIACGGTYSNNYLAPYKIEVHQQRKYFSPHWSMEAVNEALLKGQVFKALFRVNAHNRLEAYCKIDGVPTDVLVDGIASQNRAVEGDIVAVYIDPLSFWTKMKGSTEACNNMAIGNDNNLPPEGNEIDGPECKGKNKVDVDSECGYGRSGFLDKEFHNEDDSVECEPVHSNLPLTSYNQFNEYHLHISDSFPLGSLDGHNEVSNAFGRMCAMINSFPSKRPTGRVVAIIEKSPRRDTVVGYLNIKQLFSHIQYRKDMKKKKGLLSFSDQEYIQLTSTDPKFSKMMILVRNLPDCIKKRLENGDTTVEMELVAARIDDWDEDSTFPQAKVLHVLGRGGEIESHIKAILFENAIRTCDFSPDSLFCIPDATWEVPQKEFLERMDLRNLCIFTIDPPTAAELDDALSVEILSNDIFRVGVHIADMSYFVLPNTALDLEAQVRSTSVYLTQSKVPMLPPSLSENIGSLNPGLDKLAFSIFYEMNRGGEVLDRWIDRTVIRSCCKLSYEQAQNIIDGLIDSESSKISGCAIPQLHGQFEWPDVIRSVKILHQISTSLKEKRFRDGALRLDSSKVSFLFDEYGVPYDSMRCDRKDSNFIVEEFMLLANTTAADVISRAFPEGALLRRHPEPNPRKLREFEAFCFKHGLKLDASSSHRLNQSLERLRDRLKDDSVLFDILISYASRPMQLATYFCSGELKDNEKDLRHYALAVPLYTHFTSPLRRYPDIIVHRSLAATIEAEKLFLKSQRSLQKVKRGVETMRCFSGINFDKGVADSPEVREALSAAALRHGVPCTELLADVATHCNDRKLASRHVRDACDKLYMWALLKKQEICLSNARVLGLGPKFMSIYVQKLAIERRIYYDEVEGLTAEWLENTSTLVLSFCGDNRHSFRRGSPSRWRAIENVALIVAPYDLKVDHGMEDSHEIAPAVFPLLVRLLSTIPVALHAIGGDDGPLDIGVRLYTSSYLF